MVDTAGKSAWNAVLAWASRGWHRLPSPALLLPLLALGVALRLRQYAACPSYWYDEAYLLLNVFHKSCLDLLGPLREDQAAPPLFLWLLRGLYLALGKSEWWMRLPAFAASLAGLVALVPLARRLAGPAWPWALAFCTLGHHAIGHAGEVKPYAVDFLAAEVVLLATLGCLECPASLRCRATLCLLALLAPWASYPAVFLLLAAALALLLQGLLQRQRSLAYLGGLVGALLAVSVLVLWRLAIRHQATPALHQYWASSFLDLSSPLSAIVWTARCLIEAGSYGTREMGLPLLILILVGASSLARSYSPQAVLLIGPFVVAVAASALHCYPLGGRLLFFLLPCLWLLAARGLAVLARYGSRLPVSLGRVLPAGLLVPALLWAGRHMLQVTPRCQFREAFAYVERERGPEDRVWVSHPQVYEVYYGQPPPLSAYSPLESVARAGCTERLWMICAVAGKRERPTSPTMVALVQALAAPCRCRRFRGLQVTLHVPPTGR